MDGLRALAVISVLIYHIGLFSSEFSWLPGGFLGVDLFFVLSGYFITSVIVRRYEKGSFSFRFFYLRRIKRLLPAISIVLIFTIGCAWYFMLSSQLKTTAQSLLATLGFVSNFFFASGDAYVAEPSKYKPLLHTWSLAVEEQFYFVLPAAIILCLKFRNRLSAKNLVLTFTIISLIFSHFYTRFNPTNSFFLLPSRFWELGVGSLIALYKFDKIDFKPSTRLLMAVFGLTLIIAPLFLFNHDTAHPSLWTAIPVIGTGMLIVFGRKNPMLRILFANPIMVWVGLISYSLYLWHWPIFVFFVGLTDMLSWYSALTLSFLTAAASYHFWEKPLRLGADKVALGVVTSSYLLLLGLGVVFWQKGEKFSRFASVESGNIELSKLLFRDLKQAPFGKSYLGQPRKTCNQRTSKTACRFGNEEFVVLGDSLVGSIEPRLAERIPKRGFISLNHEQCSFLDSTVWADGSLPICSIVNADRTEFIKTLDSRKIFILSAHQNRLFKANKAVDDPVNATRTQIFEKVKIGKTKAIANYHKQIDFLVDQGHTVVQLGTFIRPPQEYNDEFARAVSRQKHWNFKISFGSKNDLDAILEIDEDIRSPNPEVIFIQPALLHCDPKKTENVCIGADRRGPVMIHGDHPSRAFTDIIIDEILNEVD